jgi:septum formation protein
MAIFYHPSFTNFFGQTKPAIACTRPVAIIPRNVSLTPLILASASPRRSDLLKQLNLEFQVIPSHVPEVTYDHLSPGELCQLNAYRKARAVAKQHPDAITIAADTLVCLEREAFGKPSSLDEAAFMLASLQGRVHQVVTGVCVLLLRRHQQSLFAECTHVTFRSLDTSQIHQYLERINPLDKAGAYAIQDHGELIIERIEGSFSNVVGLPIERLQRELTRWFPPS